MVHFTSKPYRSQNAHGEWQTYAGASEERIREMKKEAGIYGGD
jgi:hypothetical protein